MQEIAKFSLAPTNFDQALKYAELISKSDLAPKDFKGKPENVLIAVQMGAEVGLSPMQAIQNIAVINGRPSIWGDAALALVKVHPHFVSIKEWQDGKMSDGSAIAYCSIQRKGEELTVRSFSCEQAKKAGLLGKAGPWSQYPERMLQMRARGFAVRDAFPDALKGLSVAEDILDIDTHKYSVVQQNEKNENINQLTQIIDAEIDSNPLLPRVKKAIEYFESKGVTTYAILRYLNAESVEKLLESDLEVLSNIKSAIKEGQLTFETAFLTSGESESPYIENLKDLVDGA